jgi:hypothetical protein
MRYTRNLEALLMGQKLNLYQMALAKQEYDWLKSEVSKLHQPTVSGECVHDYQLDTLKNDILCTKCGLSKYLD